MWILINNSRLHRRSSLIPCLPLRRGYRRKATRHSWPMLSLVFLTALVAPVLPQHTDTMVEPRQRMVRDIEADVRETSSRLGTTLQVTRVLDSMRHVPRHLFVPAQARHLAYAHRPLPIGHGQTISQPYMVAVMTALLAVDANDRVLEIGTGSGYQTAILAELVQHVYSIEIISELALSAQERLHRLGYTNVEVRVGDGYYGWAEQAPYDAIIVTAAATHIPPPLLQQLKPGGRLVLPVGSPFLTQQLTWVEKTPEGSLRTRQVLPVAFVPLTGTR
jgi:protein-L-isoaspartate(D-aspartate) O-methyltransferase